MANMELPKVHQIGLILFLIYINSIPVALLKGILFMFADDKALVNVKDN